MSTRKKALILVGALAAAAVMAVVAMVVSANLSLQSELGFHETLPHNIELRSGDFEPVKRHLM